MKKISLLVLFLAAGGCGDKIKPSMCTDAAGTWRVDAVRSSQKELTASEAKELVSRLGDLVQLSVQCKSDPGNRDGLSIADVQFNSSHFQFNQQAWVKGERIEFGSEGVSFSTKPDRLLVTLFGGVTETLIREAEFQANEAARKAELDEAARKKAEGEKLPKKDERAEK